MSARQLPAELWRPIFLSLRDIVICQHGYSPTQDLERCPAHNCDSSRDVFALAITCRYLWSIGEVLIYHSIHYNADLKQTKTSKFAVACRRPTIWSHIKRFKLAASVKRIAPILASPQLAGVLPPLHRLELRLRLVKFTHTIISGLLAAQNLRELVLFGVVEGWDDDVPENWGQGRFAPRLESLVYSFDQIHTRSPTNPRSAQFFAPRSLRSIELRPAEPPILDLVVQGLKSSQLSFSDLNTLYIYQDPSMRSFANDLEGLGLPKVFTILSHCSNLRNLQVVSPINDFEHLIPWEKMPKLNFVSGFGSWVRSDWMTLVQRASCCVAIPAFQLNSVIIPSASRSFAPSMPVNITYLLLPDVACSTESLLALGRDFPNLETLLMLRSTGSLDDMDMPYSLRTGLARLPRLKRLFLDIRFATLPSEKQIELVNISREDIGEALDMEADRDDLSWLKSHVCPLLEYVRYDLHYAWIYHSTDNTWHHAWRPGPPYSIVQSLGLRPMAPEDWNL